MNRLMATAVVGLFCSLAGAWVQTGQAAGSDFSEGMALYGQKNYRGAAQKFESAMRTNPRDANTVYYCALSNQLASNRARARQLYDYINSAFPGTKYATMAAGAIKSLGDVGTASSSAGSTYSATSHSSAAASRYSGPSRFSVPFSRGRNNSGKGGIYVSVQVNNRPITFELDTGAHSTMMGANQLEELGLGRPAKGQKFKSGGVGERQDMQAWEQKVDLKFGSIYSRDFPVSVQDFYEGEPLLGRDFLQDWDISVDEPNRQVTFTRKGSGRAIATHGAMDVPFHIQGNHQVVDGFVNGRPYKFYFDTGADGVCFSMDDLKRLGMEDAIQGARQGYSQGVGGKTVTYYFPVSSIKVGPIEKNNIQIMAVEKSQMDHPLLGQSFFGEYSYDIDEANHVIHFKPND